MDLVQVVVGSRKPVRRWAAGLWIVDFMVLVLIKFQTLKAADFYF
jgi:hypothetical protein